jgi:hypothetical protein
VAAALYSAVFLCMSVGFSLIWGYALRTPGILRYRLEGAAARASQIRFGLGLLIYAVTIAVAFVSAVLCLGLHALIALYYVVDRATGQTAGEG